MARNGSFWLVRGIDDVEVSAAIVHTAEDMAGAPGIPGMYGPFNLSINQECGVLVEGFDTPPMVMMPHSRRGMAGYSKSRAISR